MVFAIQSVPSINFAPGSTEHLANVVNQLEMSKPLIVSDEGIIRHCLLDPALESLKNSNIDYCVYSDVQADPPEDNVIESLALARKNGCDSVIGFGGGSSMDVAKLVAALLSGKQSLQEMYGVDQLSSSRVPLIQVPTTAGTGSEATNVAIVTTGVSTKAGVVSNTLFADAIVLDPQLTLGLPPKVTAATGIDAMVHAIEAYTSKRLKNPVSDMLALKALSLMAPSIRPAVTNGLDLKARSDMLLGAMLAGQAFTNAPVAAVHALAYPLGGIYHIPHGLSNSLVLPHILRFNELEAEPLYRQLITVISPEASMASASHGLADYFSCLAKELGLETRLRELGVPENGLERLAEESMLQQRLLINNPRTISYEQAVTIYRQAY